MTVLCSLQSDDNGSFYVWKGVRADPTNQKPMFPYYPHCGTVAELKSKDEGLYDLRMRVIKKWFMAKDSKYASIFRHYDQVEKNW